jgi:hypothetical protein
MGYRDMPGLSDRTPTHAIITRNCGVAHVVSQHTSGEVMTDSTIKDKVALVGIGDAVEVVWEDHESVTLVQWHSGQVGPRLNVALLIAILPSTVIGLGWRIPDF